jgi:hypothetical protein
MQLHVDLTLDSPGAVSWLTLWLNAYLALQVDSGLEDPDFCYFYVVVGEFSPRIADGRVDGKSIVQAGYGGDPYGPTDARPTTLAELVGFAVRCLSSWLRRT